jgi:nucleoside phosphorylase
VLTILAPMNSEISYLRQDPALRQREGAAVQVLVIGVGKEAVQSSLSRWLAASHYPSASNSPDRLLLLGFAGAVDPALACGDLVLSRRYYLDPDTPEGVGEGDGDKFFEADSSMLEQATAAASASGVAWRGVESLTVGRPVANGEEKAAIYLSHSGRHGVGAVNMEDYWVAEFAARAEIPFLAVRAVIDTAGQAIPSYAMGLQERRWNALASATARPWQLPNLVRLAGNRRLAQRSLRRFAVAFLQDSDRLDDRLDRGKNRQPIGTK